MVPLVAPVGTGMAVLDLQESFLDDVATGGGVDLDLQESFLDEVGATAVVGTSTGSTTVGSAEAVGATGSMMALLTLEGSTGAGEVPFVAGEAGAGVDGAEPDPPHEATGPPGPLYVVISKPL